MKEKKEASMATKKQAPKKVATFPDPPDKEKADALATIALRPSVNAAAVMIEYTELFGEQDIGALVSSLSTGVDELWGGDMKPAEAMLYGQAHALQAIFVNLARRATNQEYLKHWEAYLRMALKAQSQCRMTLETLAVIKNPPVVFAKQANINNGGQQQVNNTAGALTENYAHARAGAENFSTEHNELLEQQHGQWLDIRTSGAASGADTQLEAVGKIHRAKDG